MSRRDRSNESNFDRGWGSDKPMKTFVSHDGTPMEGISLPKGVPPPSGGEGFDGHADVRIPGNTWWVRVVALLAGIFLCAWLRPMFGALVNAIG